MICNYRHLLPINECARCGYSKSKNRLHVHHLDYDHSNNEKNNLIVLCLECHTAFHRGEWKMDEIGDGIITKVCEASWKDQLSGPQKEGLRQIEELKEWMMENLKMPEEHCWFNQAALKRVTYHTLQALKNKGFLEEVYDNGREYYRRTGPEVE